MPASRSKRFPPSCQAGKRARGIARGIKGAFPALTESQDCGEPRPPMRHAAAAAEKCGAHRRRDLLFTWACFLLGRRVKRQPVHQGGTTGPARQERLKTCAYSM